MAQKSTSLHVRINDELLSQIDAYVREIGAANRSEVIRLCLHAVLGDDLQRAAVQQVFFQSDGLKRVIIGKLVDQLTEAMPKMLEAALQETAEDTFAADAAQ